MKTEIDKSLKNSDDGRTIIGYTGIIEGDLIIPEGIERIGDEAFRECDIRSVKFPLSYWKEIFLLV